MSLRLISAAAVAVFALAFASAADASVARPLSPQAVQPQARTAALPPQITVGLRTLAFRFTRMKVRARYSEWSQTRVYRYAKKIVWKWIQYEAKQCPDPLPRWFFCARPPETDWGRGLALNFSGRWPGEYRSPWHVYPVRYLRPGFVFWLECWARGRPWYSNGVPNPFYYRLTDDLWVSDAWLYTYDAPGHC